MMRRFLLKRNSATVAEGVQASNGRVAVVWQSERSSTVAWDSVEDATAVHLHAGTQFMWVDDEHGMPYRQPGEPYWPQRIALQPQTYQEPTAT